MGIATWMFTPAQIMMTSPHQRIILEAVATILGKVASITRYPVKSMAGEELNEVRLTSQGLEKDRLYAFQSTGAPPGMLRLTSTERRQMLQYAAVCCSGGL